MINKKLTKLLFLTKFWLLSPLEENTLNNENKEQKIDFAVGGQAVIEGVMMRSPNNMAIAVRKTNGDIAVKKDPHQILVQKYPWLNLPIIRGVINLFEMMIIGTKAINYSAAEAFDEIDPDAEEKQGLSKVIETVMFAFSFIFALCFSLFLFKFIPLWTTHFIQKFVPAIEENFMLFNVVDGILKMTIFLGYIYVLTLFESFRRVFQYHGAEHKAIFAYERGLELNVDNAAAQTRFHPRCGTSFIFVVFALSIVLYTFVPKQDTFLLNFSLRISVLPLIAGISYEFLKLSAKHVKHPIVKAMVQPGLWFQRLTTKEPDSSQLEVGLKSLETTLVMERARD